MTSFAFILGVLPLVIASGPGAEMRQALGTAVFFGMLGVTAFGLVFTPVFLRALPRHRRPPVEVALRRQAAARRRPSIPRNRGYSNPLRSGWRPFQPDTASNAAPRATTMASSRGPPTICRPAGRPSRVRPQGTLIPGRSR